MASKTNSKAAVTAAVLRLLRPLCKLLLRNHVAFAAFEEMVKRVYVEVAIADFGIPGKKSTVSRASVLTGLTRKDVQRILSTESGVEKVTSDESYNRAARVLTGWLRDSDFQDTGGQPARLTASEGTASFAALVRRYSGDMPVRAVLDEMLRVQAVRRCDDQRLELIARAYVPVADESEKLAILGNDVADLIGTIDHNIRLGASDPRFQRKVMYRNFPASQLPAFRELSAMQAQALLEKFDLWLSDRADVDSPGISADPKASPPAPMRLGVGIYYFEEPMVHP